MCLTALVHQFSPKVPLSFECIHQVFHMTSAAQRRLLSFNSENQLTELRAHTNTKMPLERQLRSQLQLSTLEANHQDPVLRLVSAAAGGLHRPLERNTAISQLSPSLFHQSPRRPIFTPTLQA
jgi:hypothetical protein